MNIVSLFRHYVLHWTPERAIWVGGHSFFWDARCAGIYTGVAVALVWMVVFYSRNRSLPSFSVLLVHGLLCLPFALDILSIAAGWRRPVNEIRFVTGIFMGSGIGLVLYPSFVAITLARIARQDGIGLDGRYALLLAALVVAFALHRLDHPAAWYFLTGLMILGFCTVVGCILANLTVLTLELSFSRRRRVSVSDERPEPGCRK